MKFQLSGIKDFFWPRSREIRLRRAELTFWAFLLALAYLPLPFGFLAWFALVRPLVIISKMQPKEAFKAAYFYGFMSNIFQLYWIAYVTPPGMVAAVFIMSLYPAAILLIFNRLYNIKKSLGLVILPFLWAGMEYFRSLSQFAFPWTDLSYSQGYYLTLIQIVSVIGSYGLTIILVYWNILLWQTVNRMLSFERRILSFTVFLATLGLVYSYGWIEIPAISPEGDYRVTLLQGDVDLETKWKLETRERNFDLYDSLAQSAASDSSSLMIWPETAAPCYPRLEPHYRYRLSRTAVNSNTTQLLGALDAINVDGKRKSYNSAFSFTPEGTMDGVYHKIKLVPFSEHSPYQDQIPFLTRDFLMKYVTAIKTHQVQWWSDFYPGDSIILFNADSVDYSVLICFEAAFPDYVSEGVRKGAKFLTNITNDTWFGRSPGPYQHMRIAVFRAVENRIWLARCANTGISALIDPWGFERVNAGLYRRAVISGYLKPLKELSIFTRTGPIAGKYSLWLTLFYALFLIGRKIIIGRK